MSTNDEPSDLIPENTSVMMNSGIAGLKPKNDSNRTQSLTNFGFIPRKKARDSTGELSAQISNQILDPEQSAPIICEVPISSRSEKLVDKEFNHNPKNILGRKRVVLTNSENERRDYSSEQCTVTMIRAVIETYPNIFSVQGVRKNELHCDICFKLFKSAKMSHVKEHIETILHKKNFEKRKQSQQQVVLQRNFIKEYFDETRAKGESLDMETLAFRVSTVKVFLRTGVPILKIDG